MSIGYNLELWEAAAQGHVAEVARLLSSGADPNTQRPTDKSSCLYIACQNGHVECCKLLLDGGASVNLARDTQATPLFIATQHNRVGCIEMLLARGADVHLRNDQRATPFTLACSMGHREAAKMLLEAGSDRHDVATGLSPLQWARKNGHQATKQLLLQGSSELLRRKFVFELWRKFAVSGISSAVDAAQLRQCGVIEYPFDVLTLDNPMWTSSSPMISFEGSTQSCLPAMMESSRSHPGALPTRETKGKQRPSSHVNAKDRPPDLRSSRRNGPLVSAVRTATEVLAFVPPSGRETILQSYVSNSLTPESHPRQHPESSPTASERQRKLLFKSTPLYM